MLREPVRSVFGRFPHFYDTPASINGMAEVHDEAGSPLEGIPKKSNCLFVSFFGLARDIRSNRYSHVWSPPFLMVPVNSTVASSRHSKPPNYLLTPAPLLIQSYAGIINGD